jgi:hypothetical protein
MKWGLLTVFFGFSVVGLFRYGTVSRVFLDHRIWAFQLSQESAFH